MGRKMEILQRRVSNSKIGNGKADIYIMTDIYSLTFWQFTRDFYFSFSLPVKIKSNFPLLMMRLTHVFKLSPSKMLINTLTKPKSIVENQPLINRFIRKSIFILGLAHPSKVLKSSFPFPMCLFGYNLAVQFWHAWELSQLKPELALVRLRAPMTSGLARGRPESLRQIVVVS